jgi:Mrp family chromosome partitioning ATPase
MSAALSCALESAVGAGDADLSGRGLELLMRYREEREQQLMANWRLAGRG